MNNMARWRGEEIDKLRKENEELRANMTESTTLSPSQVCVKYHIQNCHACDRADCGDNQTPSILELRAELTKEREMRENAEMGMGEWRICANNNAKDTKQLRDALVSLLNVDMYEERKRVIDQVLYTNRDKYITTCWDCAVKHGLEQKVIESASRILPGEGGPHCHFCGEDKGGADIELTLTQEAKSDGIK